MKTQAKMDEKTLSPDQVAELRGVSRMTVFRALKSGALPSILDGRRRIITEADLAVWIGDEDAKALIETTTKRCKEIKLRERDILNLLRYALPDRMRECGYPTACFYAEIPLIAMKAARRRVIADGILSAKPQPPCNPGENGTLIIEIGNYKARWPETVPVLYISSAGQVNIINPTGSQFEQTATKEIRAIIHRELVAKQAQVEHEGGV